MLGRHGNMGVTDIINISKFICGSGVCFAPQVRRVGPGEPR